MVSKGILHPYGETTQWISHSFLTKIIEDFITF